MSFHGTDHSSHAVTPAQVETWFRQAASGVTAEPLQAWINAVQLEAVQSHQSGHCSLGTQAVEICLALLQHHADVTIRFYALSTLAQWPTCLVLMTTPQSPLPLLTQVLVQRLDPQILQQYAFFRNKVAAVFVHVCLLGVNPSTNNNLNDHSNHSVHQNLPLDLVAQLQPPAFFCKVVSMLLEALSTEYYGNDPIPNAVWYLKQQVRTRNLKQAWWAQTKHTLQAALAHPTIDTALAVLALQTLQAFWAYGSPSSHESYTNSNSNHSNVITMDETILQAIRVPDASVAVAALETWYEWAGSTALATESMANTNHIATIQALLQTIHEANFLPYQGESDSEIEVVIAAAKLVDAVGLLVLNQKATAEACWPAVWDLLQRGFAYDDIDVAAAVLPLVTHLVQSPALATTHLPTLLQILVRLLPYPVDFTYDFANDDICAEEEMFRVQLDKLYRRMVQAAPLLVLQVVQEQTRQLLQSTTGNVASPQQLEAVLRLVYHYVEGIRPSPGLTKVMANAEFCQLLVSLLHTSNVAHSQQHPQVLRLYFETAVRYYPLYQQYDEYLSQLLVHLTGNLGLQHGSAQLRSRCCYLLLRLVKALVKRLAPMVQKAVQGILGLLENPALALLPDDTLYLFETIGLLLGKTGLPPTDQQTYLAQIMTPHIQSIEQGLATALSMPNPAMEQTSIRTDDSDDDGEEEDGPSDPVAQALAQSISAITFLSKGFPKRPPEPVQVVLLETLNVTLKVLQGLPDREPIRNKCMTLFQRMIQCLVESESSRRHLLTLVPRYLAPLIQHCTADDCMFVGQIFNQICVKCKAEAIPAVDEAFLPFLQKCQSLITSSTTDIIGHNGSHSAPPHLAAEQLAVQKVTFIVVEVIVTNDATPLLLSPANGPNLQSVLVLVGQGAVQSSEPVVRKTCLHILLELVDQWLKPQQALEAHAHGLLTVLYQTVIPGVLTVFATKEFDERDGQHNRNVVDFAKLLHALVSIGETDNVMTSIYATNAPSGSLDALHSADTAKAVELLLMTRLSEWKGRRQN